MRTTSYDGHKLFTQYENQTKSLKSDASSSSRILHSQLVSEIAGKAASDPSVEFSATSHVAEQKIDLSEPFGRTKKPQEPESSYFAEQDRVSYDQANSTAVNLDGKQLNAIPEDSVCIEEDRQPHGRGSLSIEEIDSFTVDMRQSPVSPSKEISKRKALDATRSTPQKKRRVQQSRSPHISGEQSASQHSPSVIQFFFFQSFSPDFRIVLIPRISSFSRSMIDHPLKNALQPKDKPSAPVKTKQLDLCPLDEILQSRQRAPLQMKPTEVHVDPPTSPIEDPSAALDDSPQGLDRRTKPLESASSSKLVFDIQERISSHNSTKRRDKVMKLTPKPVLPEPTGGKVTAHAEPSEHSIINVSSSPSSREKSPGRAKPISVKPTLKRMKDAKPVAPRSSSNRKDVKTPRIRLTPVEYARQLNASVAERVQAEEGSSNGSRPRRYKCLEGRNIFYAGGDMTYATEGTRKRMDLV